MAGLGQNRVYDISQIETLKSTAIRLLDTGIESCMTWDRVVSELKSLQGQTPIKSSQLSETLDEISEKMYQSEYETDKCWIEGALNNVIANIPQQDVAGASLLEPLNENLQYVVTMIEDLSGCIEVAGTNLNFAEFKEKVEGIKCDWEEDSLEKNMEAFETCYLGMLANVSYSEDILSYLGGGIGGAISQVGNTGFIVVYDAVARVSNIPDEKELEDETDDYGEHNGEIKKEISENGIYIIEVPNRTEQVLFLNAILEGAIREDIYNEVPWQVTMAQAALETGWGKNEMIDIYTGKRSNNLFGIKYFGETQNDNEYVRVWTTEVIREEKLEYWKEEHAKWAKNGEELRQISQKGGKIEIKVIQPFKVFETPSESIVEHSKVLEDSYYEEAKKYKDNPYLYTKEIASMYATDPQYADKLIQIIDKYMAWDSKEIDKEYIN